MNIQKINWKFNFKNPEAIHLHDFLVMFNGWIPESPEIFIDVADYGHVHDGPLMLLAGHFVDYVLDDTDRTRGFLYNRKGVIPGSSNAEIIKNSLKEFVTTCDRLQKAQKELKLDTTSLIFIVNDRALAPNTPATFAELKNDLEKVLSQAFAPQKISLKHRTDPKQRFTVEVSIGGEKSIQEILKAL